MSEQYLKESPLHEGLRYLQTSVKTYHLNKDHEYFTVQHSIIP